jgi:hypothetical protein
MALFLIVILHSGGATIQQRAAVGAKAIGGVAVFRSTRDEDSQRDGEVKHKKVRDIENRGPQASRPGPGKVKRVIHHES